MRRPWSSSCFQFRGFEVVLCESGAIGRAWDGNVAEKSGGGGGWILVVFGCFWRGFGEKWCFLTVNGWSERGGLGGEAGCLMTVVRWRKVRHEFDIYFWALGVSFATDGSIAWDETGIENE